MDYGRPDTRDRITSAAGVTTLHALLGYALIMGLGVDVKRDVDDTLKVFDVPVAPPPPPPLPPAPAPLETPSKAAKRAPAPPNLKAAPSPVVAQAPVVRLKVPKVIAAPVADVGVDREAGASDRPGPGTGAGGDGSGTGGGGLGDGWGAGSTGEDGGIFTGARRIGGRITESDLPPALKLAGARGMVLTRYSVGPDGRVASCEIRQSSGYPELDAHTCRLIISRFRYLPARDAAGRAVTDRLSGWHRWRGR